MRILFTVLIFLVPAPCVWAAPKKPILLAFYHPWYRTPWGPSKGWQQWDSFKFRGRYDPEDILPNGRRNIAATGYPLIGPYDVTDREVVRWHFRLAKAAGIEGMICSWWRLPRADATWDWQADLFERVLLPVAAEEDFKVAVLDECAHYVRDERAMLWRIKTYLPRFAKHPAYLKIDGQPVWFVYQVWDDWLKSDVAARYVREAQEEVGDVYWIFDKMRAVGISERPGARLTVEKEWLAIPEIDCFGGYSLWTNWRVTDAADIRKLYSDFTGELRRANKAAQLPVSPGHDNTPVSEQPFVVPRKEGEPLRAFLAAVDAAGPRIAIVCSFNEWGEGTQVEPSAGVAEPYRDLKVLSEWRGRTWAEPPLPPAGSRDPLHR